MADRRGSSGTSGGDIREESLADSAPGEDKAIPERAVGSEIFRIADKLWSGDGVGGCSLMRFGVDLLLANAPIGSVGPRRLASDIPIDALIGTSSGRGVISLSVLEFTNQSRDADLEIALKSPLAILVRKSIS